MLMPRVRHFDRFDTGDSVPPNGRRDGFRYPHAIRQSEWTEDTQREFNSRKLVSKEQLPDVDAAIFELTWDSAVKRKALDGDSTW